VKEAISKDAPTENVGKQRVGKLSWDDGKKKKKRNEALR